MDFYLIGHSPRLPRFTHLVEHWLRLWQSSVMASNPDAQLFAQFLDAKGVSNKCPRCNTSNWLLNNQPSPWGGIWGKNAEGSFSLDSPIFEISILICTNCGFVSPHAKHYYDQWVEGRKEK
ncbi:MULTISPECIES: hypothetical protein [unclassified Bradyrhizobium]|uniref:hypothetical protein n=1 Tax=unclassified Bradyrhizobium TaxID=2631580 RepID=UPI001FFA6D99|nr:MULTISPECIES: hypothetical protein [unclassified Bradyrhizobium]MCK1329514.1 hypothetical protein [Bradyrhizobium sp. CW9]MCK1501725.1 hypothetical protein [Bradyrhizobium sp. 188]MCK1505514.1 hypothetical protein [Bradyrhizobium sp. 18]MCK1583071.1 hypothetical protein [Bradyrhizobium sp. 168]MCK1592142.1 hypothetical protein [Bradyrhizobium sp. 169]